MLEWVVLAALVLFAALIVLVYVGALWVSEPRRRGRRGPVGSDGLDATGADGSTGDTGADGWAAPLADTGIDGFTGAKGFDGPPPETGPTGAGGLEGDTGPTGDSFDGPQGKVIDYLTGATGPTGPTGQPGAESDVEGPTGMLGASLTGPTGPGIQGPTGITGPTGGLLIGTGPMGASFSALSVWSAQLDVRPTSNPSFATDINFVLGFSTYVTIATGIGGTYATPQQALKVMSRSVPITGTFDTLYSNFGLHNFGVGPARVPTGFYKISLWTAPACTGQFTETNLFNEFAMGTGATGFCATNTSTQVTVGTNDLYAVSVLFTGIATGGEYLLGTTNSIRYSVLQQ